LALATGVVVGLVFGLAQFARLREDSDPSYDEDDRNRDIDTATTAAAIAMAIIALAAIIYALAASGLSDEELAKAKEQMLGGIGRFWTRTGSHGVTIDDMVYDVTARGVEREEDAVPFTITKPLFPGQRAVNLSMIVPFLPNLCPWEPGEEDHVAYGCAHELGHTVLARDVDEDFSIRHKGTTGGALDQNPLPTAPFCPHSGEIDLMLYYQHGSYPGDYYERMVAAEEDVLRLFRIARIEWRLWEDAS
ncbi:MAG: hypothetical protein AAGA56_29280, partial [Myxococcota bacterium]